MRRISPTRPHPLVSRRPPGQALSALPLTVLDRGRDRLQWLDEITSGRWSGRLAGADRALAGAAGTVERIPLLQRGERAATRQPLRDAAEPDHTGDPQLDVDGPGRTTQAVSRSRWRRSR